MDRQEIIDLLESINTVNLRALADWLDIKFKDDPSIEVQTDLRLWANKIDQALTLLKQQPTAGELTKQIRLNFKDKTLFRGYWPRLHLREIMREDVLELCDRLDTAEAEIKRFLACCENEKEVVAAREAKLKTAESINADLLEACKAQHQAIDTLFACLVLKDEKFFPSKSGQPWEAIQQGNTAIAKSKKQRDRDMRESAKAAHNSQSESQGRVNRGRPYGSKIQA